MKREPFGIIAYIASVVCLALFIAGGVLLTASTPVPHEHVGGHIYATQATCLSAGNVEYWHCEECGKYFADELLTEEIAYADTVIAQLPHEEETLESTPATCTSAGITEGKRCTVCDTVILEQTVIAKLPHTVEIIKGTPATCTASGISNGSRCTTCDTVITEQRVINALGHAPEFIKEEQSTCFIQGNPDYYRCARCKGNFAEEQCATALSHEDISYPLAEHTYKQCFNDTRHYMKATCGHDLKKESVEHDFTDGVCADCGFNDCHVTYTLNNDGTAYSVTGRSLYAANIVIFPEYDGLPVTTIGTYAFSGDTLSSISLPASITKIGKEAFRSCNNLEEMTVDANNPVYESKGNCIIEKATKTLAVGCKTSVIPDDGSILSIGEYAFYGRKQLTEITIPDGVTSIDQYAFYSCSNLTSVNIPESVERISTCAFHDCTGLEELNFSTPSNLTDIGGYAFENCSSLKKLHIPSSVTALSILAFGFCSALEEITVDPHNSVYESINNCIINRNYKSLVLCCNKSVIPNFSGVTEIDQYAYSSLQITTLHIPANITSISEYSFCELPALEKITVDPTNKYYYVKNNCLIEKSTQRLLLGCKNSIIPDDGSVKEICSHAFRGCTALTDLHIPASVRKICNHAFLNTDIKNLYLDDLRSWLTVKFERVSVPMALNPLQIGGNIYVNGELLTELTIPDGITAISEYHFKNCLSLTKVVIPDHVTKVDYAAFRGCENVTEFIMGDGVTEHLTLGSLKKLQTLVLGDGVTEIRLNEFMGKQELTNVTFGKNITEIGSSAFFNCPSLTEIVLPDGLQTLGGYAFCKCSNLSKVTIGGNVTRILRNTFGYCTSLSDIYFDGTKEQWLEIAAKGWDYDTGDYVIHFNDGTTMQKGEE